MPEETEAIIEAEGVEQEEPTEESAPSGGILRRILLMLPLILVPAVGGAWLAYDQHALLAEKAVAAGLSYGFATVQHEDGPIQYGHFEVLTDLLINPAGSSGKRFLLINLGLESSSEAVFEEIALKDVVIRDAILASLGRRTVEDLSRIDIRDQLKAELRATINSFLEKGQIDRLYFTQYVLQ